jgi:hypothetical protein
MGARAQPDRVPRFAAVFLLLLGSLGMLGHVLGSETLRGLAAMTCASPAPKVFSAVKGLERSEAEEAKRSGARPSGAVAGLETYSTKFRIEWIDHEGGPQSVLLTPELYARLGGPYNRRNVYGAVLAFGPVLVSDARTKPMWTSIMRYAACGERPLLAELGIDPKSVGGKLRVVLEPLYDIGELPRVLEAPCP